MPHSQAEVASCVQWNMNACHAVLTRRMVCILSLSLSGNPLFSQKQVAPLAPYLRFKAPRVQSELSPARRGRLSLF